MYPLPTEKANVARIGKGGNGYVFILFHEKKQYAVKKVHTSIFSYMCMQLIYHIDCVSFK